MKKFLCVLAILSLMGCDSQDPDGGTQAGKMGDGETVSTPKTAKTDTNQTETDTPNTPTIGADSLVHLDLEKFNTGISPANPKTYPYPFATDSEPVKNYAKEYNITPAQAQLAMTLSMASPEALNKVLDQIVGEYVGHSLTDGANMSLVVYTSDKVAPSDFDYVIADKFGEGLILPVKVVPISQAKDKPQVDIKSVSEKFKKDEADDNK